MSFVNQKSFFFSNFSNLTRPEELTLKLTENGKPTDPEEDWGTIQLCVTLIPKTQQEREQVSWWSIMTIKCSGITSEEFLKSLLSNCLSTVLQQRLSQGLEEAEDSGMGQCGKHRADRGTKFACERFERPVRPVRAISVGQ